MTAPNVIFFFFCLPLFVFLFDNFIFASSNFFFLLFFQDSSVGQSEWRRSARCRSPDDTSGRFCRQHDLGNCQAIFLFDRLFIIGMMSVVPTSWADIIKCPCVFSSYYSSFIFLLYFTIIHQHPDSSTRRQQRQSGNEPSGTFKALGRARWIAGHRGKGCGCDCWLDRRRWGWNG